MKLMQKLGKRQVKMHIQTIEILQIDRCNSRYLEKIKSSSKKIHYDEK